MPLPQIQVALDVKHRQHSIYNPGSVGFKRAKEGLALAHCSFHVFLKKIQNFPFNLVLRETILQISTAKPSDHKELYLHLKVP